MSREVSSIAGIHGRGEGGEGREEGGGGRGGGFCLRNSRSKNARNTATIASVVAYCILQPGAGIFNADTSNLPIGSWLVRIIW